MDLFLRWTLTTQNFLKLVVTTTDAGYSYNTSRIARIDFSTFETVEIIEIPNAAGNHSSAYVTQNTDHVFAGTRFSVSIPQEEVPIESYKEKFKGVLSFVSVDKETGRMEHRTCLQPARTTLKIMNSEL